MTTPKLPSAEDLVDRVLIWIEDLPKQIEVAEDYRNAVLEAAAEVAEEIVEEWRHPDYQRAARQLIVAIRALKKDL